MELLEQAFSGRSPHGQTDPLPMLYSFVEEEGPSIGKELLAKEAPTAPMPAASAPPPMSADEKMQALFTLSEGDLEDVPANDRAAWAALVA